MFPPKLAGAPALRYEIQTSVAYNARHGFIRGPWQPQPQRIGNKKASGPAKLLARV